MMFVIAVPCENDGVETLIDQSSPAKQQYKQWLIFCNDVKQRKQEAR